MSEREPMASEPRVPSSNEPDESARSVSLVEFSDAGEATCPHCGHFVDWHFGLPFNGGPLGEWRYKCRCGCVVDEHPAGTLRELDPETYEPGYKGDAAPLLSAVGVDSPQISSTDRCASYNWQVGTLPQIALPKPSWSDRTGDTIMVDHCIASVAQAIWDAGYVTLSSCCGHGRDAPSLVLGNSSDGSPEIVAEIRKIIARVDGRAFRLYQWQLVELTERRGNPEVAGGFIASSPTPQEAADG